MKRMTEAEAKSFAEKWLAGKIKGTEFTGAVGEPWKCLHHMIPYELTTEPVVNRVVYVLLRKRLDEIEVRLAEMEPWIWERFPALEQAQSDYDKAWSDALPQINEIIRRERPDSKWTGAKIEGTA